MDRSVFVLVSVFVVMTWVVSRADDVEAGHSKHGEAFNEGPRQAAVLMKGTGNVHFEITTKSKEAQRFFDQGIGQQHGFWYFEAERSFRQASKLDPEAAMPFWGMAMANVNNEKRARQFTKRATEKKANASKREQLWIGVLEKFYTEDKRDKKQREQDYINGLEEICHAYPKDVEALSFLCWKLWQAKDSIPIASYEAVDALLDKVFALDPNHPSHHYRIHLWDNKKPIRALASDALCGQAAPGIAHMWHMPGHTFSKLGRYDDAAWQQEASTRVDHAYMQRAMILPDQIHNYAHNEEWLIRTYNELGRAKDAIALAKALIANPRHPNYNTLDKAASSASYGRTRLLETLVKWELWDKVMLATGGSLIPSVKQSGHELTRLLAIGTAAYFKGDKPRLAETLKQVNAIKETPKEEIRKAEAPDKKKQTTTPVASKKPKGPTEQEKARLVLTALQSLKADDIEKAKDHMSKELLAAVWIKLGNKTKAAEVAARFPQDLAGSARQTETYVTCGKVDEAKKSFQRVRERAYAMDKDLPIFRRLTALAEKLQTTGDWVKPAPKRTDSGVRPEITSLGPVHWQAPQAPAWEGMAVDHRIVSDKDYSGKPVVLVFYIGSTCGHCMEQLNAMENAYEEFKKRNLPLVALSPEPVGLVGNAGKFAKNKTGFPFPILAARDKEVFRAFRAWDDFEDVPLHAVAIIDAQGKLRWLDVSYEPFMNAKFVAEEAERLLQ
ncbi:MAG: redoxin domain-containing protein [Verrucomicrobiaceae bacterium]|nr:redoxin domain-containing protein [Verrucomicrobiaceae bacterium]